jgi:hypothetical protein
MVDHASSCRGGGIGRRKGLKIPRPQGHAGSTPAPGRALIPRVSVPVRRASWSRVAVVWRPRGTLSVQVPVRHTHRPPRPAPAPVEGELMSVADDLRRPSRRARRRGLGRTAVWSPRADGVRKAGGMVAYQGSASVARRAPRTSVCGDRHPAVASRDWAMNWLDRICAVRSTTAQRR